MNDSSLTLLIIVQRVIVYAEASLGHLILKNVRHSLTWSLDVSFTHSFIHSFIHSLIHPFIHSFTHSFIHSFIHSFTHSLLWVRWLKEINRSTRKCSHCNRSNMRTLRKQNINLLPSPLFSSLSFLSSLLLFSLSSYSLPSIVRRCVDQFPVQLMTGLLTQSSNHTKESATLLYEQTILN